MKLSKIPIIPTNGEIQSEPLPTALRRRIAKGEFGASARVEGDPTIYRLPDSISEAKHVLEFSRNAGEDNNDPEYEKFVSSIGRINSVLGQYIQSGEQVFQFDSDPLRERLDILVENNKDKGFDLTSEFITPSVLYTVNQLSGLKVTEDYINNEQSDIYALIEDAKSHEGGIIPLVSYIGNHLTEEESIWAIRLFIEVAYSPLSNFISFTALRMIEEGSAFRGAQKEISARDIFKKVCSIDAPTYPGLFRSSDSGEQLLVPTSWEGTTQNFTFGYGSHSCPGRGFSYMVFEGFFRLLQTTELTIKQVEYSAHLPYRILSLRVRPQ